VNQPTFQTDRSDYLRQRLVELPMKTIAAPDRVATAANPLLRQGWRTLSARTALVGVAACAGLIAVSQTGVAIQSAHASGVLASVADKASLLPDDQPGPGEYLLVRTHANWGWTTTRNESGATEQTIDLYVPSDPAEDWVLDRDWGNTGPGPQGREVLYASNGEFYGSQWGGSWNAENIAALPRDGRALYNYFDSTYQGGSASRDDNNFVRITDLLRTGLVPADVRTGLYDALALIPGVTTTEDQPNLDGREGVAIGRTEPLHAGERQEIIVDPNSGLLIGERTVIQYAVYGLGPNRIASQTAIEYDVVGNVPKPQSR